MRVSIEHQRLMRTKYHLPLLDKVSSFLAEVGDKYFITIAVSVACNTLSTHKLFIFVLVSSLSIAITNLMKGVFQEPRPFFLEDLKPYICRLEHGDPSGHSL